MSPDDALTQLAREYGFPLDAEIKSGGQYTPALLDGNNLYISGQIPRIGNTVHFIGTVGDDITLDDAKRAATISALRALTLAKSTLGSLSRIASAPRMTVFVRSHPNFTQQSEVADGASKALYTVLGSVGLHTRTSIGVLQLPKGAAVEADFIFGVKTGD